MTKEDHIYGDFMQVRLHSNGLFFELQQDDFWEKRNFKRGKMDFAGEDEDDYGLEGGPTQKTFDGGLTFVKPNQKKKDPISDRKK